MTVAAVTLDDPLTAEREMDRAFAALLRKVPAPARRIIGDLSNTEKVLVGLDVRYHALDPRGILNPGKMFPD